MAKCPKCNKPIPYYKSLIYTKFIGIKCNYCGSVAIIEPLPLRIFLVVSAVLVVYFIDNFIYGFQNKVIVFILYLLSAILIEYSTWDRVKLHIKDESPK